MSPQCEPRAKVLLAGLTLHYRCGSFGLNAAESKRAFCLPVLVVTLEVSIALVSQHRCLLRMKRTELS